jgi:hypothetical protein
VVVVPSFEILVVGKLSAIASMSDRRNLPYNACTLRGANAVSVPLQCVVELLGL